MAGKMGQLRSCSLRSAALSRHPGGSGSACPAPRTFVASEAVGRIPLVSTGPFEVLHGRERFL